MPDALAPQTPRLGLRLVARWILLALVVGGPWFLYTAGKAHEARQQGLLTRGVATEAHVTGYSTASGKRFAHFEYQVDGNVYTGSVSADNAPMNPGLPLTVVYLPEEPRHHHAGRPLTSEDIERERRASWTPVVWPALLFGAAFGGNEVDIRRRRRNAAAGPALGPAAARRLVAGLILAVLLGVQLDPNVRATSVEAFGARPLGLPNLMFVLVLTTLLWLPLPWVLRHGMALLNGKLAAGYGPRQFVWKRFVGRADAPPDLRRSQAAVLFGALYMFVLVAGWIAYTAWRGI
ncbi:MAG TPA: hypothetical protein VFB66_07630 [Tepidisphaeraceae bacterium]|nr:hypothetical protein [Tepidisphaeraceae bacterium]